MRRFYKNLCAIRIRNPPSSLYNFNITRPIEPTCHVPIFVVSHMSLLQTSCFDAFKAAARQFCSEVAPLGPTFDCSMNDVGDKCLESDGDKLYNVVIEHSYAYHNMEGSLDQLGVKLTTELVVEVLHRLRFEEKIAFRFFNWAGHQENYAHEPPAYNDMIDILSSTKYKVKQFRIVCDLLDYMKRHEKKKVPVEVLLKILREYTEKHLTYLQKFAKKKRIRVKTQPEINAFNLLLDALCKCSLVIDAEAMFTPSRRPPTRRPQRERSVWAKSKI